MLKFEITIAFPGTTMFSEGVKNNWIKLYNLNGFLFIQVNLVFFSPPWLTSRLI